MKFVADEGVDRQIVDELRRKGHDVVYILEEGRGTPDDIILAIANQENRILITRDKDFGELVYHLRKVHSGIVLNRLYQLTSTTKAKLVLQVIEEHGETLKGYFTVIRPGSVKMRKL